MKLLQSLLLATGLLATGPALAHSYASADFAVVLDTPDVYVGYREAPRYRDYDYGRDYYVADHRRYRGYARHSHRHDRHCRHGHGKGHRRHHDWHH